MKKKVLAMALTAIFISIVGVGCGGTGKETLDFKDICAVTISGLNGYADATAKLDVSNLDKLFNEKQYALSDFYLSLKCELSSDKKLSNGDKVTVTAKYDEEMRKAAKINLSNETFTVDVSGLKDAVEIDPFENLKVTFIGPTTKGTCNIDKSACSQFVKDKVRLTVSSDSDNGKLFNGKRITIYTKYELTDAIEAGYVFSTESKMYTVSGLLGFPKTLDGCDLSKIDEASKEKLDKTISEAVSPLEWIGIAPEYAENFSDVKIAYEPVKKYFLSDNGRNPYGVKHDETNNYITAYKLTATATCIKSADVMTSWDWWGVGKERSKDTYVCVMAKDIFVDDDKNAFFNDFSSFDATTHSKLEDAIYDCIYYVDKWYDVFDMTSTIAK